ncbi:D-3-phosphoglycerate dehydrogenase [Catalinimonas alkaloidigena]|uniref:phosphoglycerate dehydrogenase n=1 Tax=Catalinimonas alkaloidigena TaxID=1075417 RepID=UPI002406A2FF|nr:phosphoglycerate dehydrogenase [Catalinimonas alkaloidigena]MDF9796176.1 D-3-phosphoglycerate dehydrogenase [Catalinimonas alkaloidigena]
MKSDKYFVFDFDSTFTKVEALDILCEISLKGNPEKDNILKQVQDITNTCMEGNLSFRESLEKRLALLNAHKEHLTPLIDYLRENVSVSFKRNREFFETYSDNIYIISNGFKSFIVPIVKEYGIKEPHVFANEFEFDEEGNIVGYDQNNLLSGDDGKSQIIKSLDLHGDVYVIGDGYNDYKIKAAGFANKFYAFTENIERQSILEKADHITPSLDEFLYLNKMNTAISYPKNRINVLLLENIHPDAEKKLREEGYNVEIHPAAMDEEELAERIKNVSILGIRSKTHVTEKVLENANRLIALGAFCIGTNQIDLVACQKKGVAVFNAPYSNTRSVVEMAIAEIIFLMRGFHDKSMGMHQGKWLKSASNSNEVRGKKLGIIGYGSIGAQLSVLAENLGMDVYYYDLIEKLALGNATKCNSMEELLGLVDVVTLHVDGRASNKKIIDAYAFRQMKDGMILLNLSRGSVVDIEALKENIENGKIRGAAIDVFPEEPKSNDEEFISELRGLPNVILSPHVGGSTLEAQENIADFVPNKIMEYVNTGSTTNSVNFPNLQLPLLQNAHRLMHIHMNVPGVLAKISNILAEHNINVVGQYLKTNETIGYVIIDIDKAYDDAVIQALKSIDNTIRFRVLY